MTGLRAAAIGASLALSAAGLAAQRGGQTPSTPPPPTQAPSTPRVPQQPLFRATTELVEIDCVVVDKDGNAVRGLKQSDFVVRDRGKPQNLSAFEEVSHEQPETPDASAPSLPPTLKIDVANNQDVQADRLVILVVDDLHIFQGRTDRAKDLARQIITQLGNQASMAVLFTSGQHSTQVTEDRSELFAAVDTLKARQSFRKPHDAVDSQRPGAGDPEQDVNDRMTAFSAATQNTLQDFFDNMQQFQTIEQAAQMLGGDDTRRKAFVLLTEGIAKDMSGIFGHLVSVGDAPPDQPIMTSIPTTHYTDLKLIEMMEALRRANVATYAIDPRGHVSPQDLALESFPDTTTGLGDNPGSGGFRWTNPVRMAQDSLQTMAVASGGFAVTDTDDFTSGLHKVIEDIDHYYLLGFNPSDPSGTGYRPLDVRVPGHPDWTLRFRHGYMPGGSPAPKNDDPLVALSAGVLPKSDLPMQLWAAPFPGPNGAAPPVSGASMAGVAVAIQVTSPSGMLKDTDGRLRDDVSYEVLVVDDKTSKVVSRTREDARFVLSGSSTGDMPDTVSYQIPLWLNLPAGRYQVRASTTSTKLVRGGSVYLTLEVPDFTKNAITVSGIEIGYADGAHVPVGRGTAAAPDVPATGVSASAVPPAPAAAAPSGGALPFPPSLNREFAPSDTIRVYAAVARVNPAVALTATVAVLDEKGAPVASTDRQITATDSTTIDLKLPLAGLAAGAYRVRVTVADRENHSSEREVGILIK